MELHWLPVVYIIQFKLALVMFTTYKGHCPDYFVMCRRATVIWHGLV